MGLAKSIQRGAQKLLRVQALHSTPYNTHKLPHHTSIYLLSTDLLQCSACAPVIFETPAQPGVALKLGHSGSAV